MEVRQDPFDPHKGLFKIEPVHVSVRPEETDLHFEKVQTFKTENGMIDDKFNFESQSTEQFAFANVSSIKQEIVECEEPKIEQRSDLPVKIEDTSDVRNIGADLLVDKNAIKQEVSEHLQVKIESELLTSHCDLPTLKYESAVYPDYFEQPCSSKTERVTKSLKSFAKYVRYKKKRRYTCPVCLKSFSCSKSKLNHIVRHFGKRSANHRSQFWKQKQPNDSVGKYHQECFYCGRIFVNSLQFLEHFVIYHYVKKQTKSPLKCKYCLKDFAKLDEHMKIHTLDKLFEREICSKNFQTNSKPMRCKIFSKRFSYKSNFKRHLKTHTEEKPFNCEICSKQFRLKTTLYNHLRTHTKEKPYMCEICSKQFRKKCDLKSHLKIHTGEKPYKCEMCPKQFRQKTHLKSHLEIHTDTKSFMCEICSKQFRRKFHFNEHLKSHTREKPFKCVICSKRFSRKDVLKKHLKIHTGEKPFKCEICSKEFRHNSDLKSHLKIHTEEKPFKCEFCSKRFRHKSNLSVHLKIRSKKKPFKCV